jgi:hypothetical protein
MASASALGVTRSRTADDDPAHATPPSGLTAEHAGDLVDDLDDPYRLRRTLARIARDHPDLDVPAIEHAADDLTEALRRSRAATRRPSPAAERRYRILELLIVERYRPDQAARAEHVSERTYYRDRQTALAELAYQLDDMWRARAAEGEAEVAVAGVAEPAGQESIPHPRTFLGRDAELRQARSLLEEARLLLVGGPAGIGKTAFGASLARHVAAERPVLWHRFRPGLTDTVGGLLFAIGQHLGHQGAPALAAFLRQTSTSSPWELLAQDLAVHSLNETHSAIFLDDGDTIAENPPVASLVASLHAQCRSTWIAVMARERLPSLPEAARLELRGLDPEVVRSYLAEEGVHGVPDEVVSTLAAETGGNPQLLHLAAGAILHAEIDPAQLRERLLDVPDIREFFFDHIFRHLSEGQQVVLGAASLLRRPVAASFLAAALEGLAPAIPSTLAELGRRFLFSSSTDGLRLHSTVREFARRVLTPGQSADLHGRIAATYERAGQPDEACYHWLEMGDVARARNALLASPTDVEPHLHARLQMLARRLHALGLGDDPELARYSALLNQRRALSAPRRPADQPG